MKLILHIGTEKTGSTTIQAWLHHNAAALRAQGVWYSDATRPPGRNDCRWISVYGRDSQKPDDGFRLAGIESEADHAAFRAALEKSFAAEVSRARSAQARMVVISSEHLHSRINTVEEAAQILSLVEGYFEDISVLCYLRPQAELLQSRISVGIRMLAAGPRELATFKFDRPYYDYAALQERWASSFETLDFVPFSRTGNVIEDFCQRLGLALSDFDPGTRNNEKLDFRIGQMAYNLMRGQVGKDDIKPFVSVPPAFFDRSPTTEPVRISQDLAENITAEFRPSNEALTRAIPGLELADLEPRPGRFVDQGNADRMFVQWDAAEAITELVATANYGREIEVALRLLSEAELYLERGQPNEAHNRLAQVTDLSIRLHRAQRLAWGRSLCDITERLQTLHRRVLAARKTA